MIKKITQTFDFIKLKKKSKLLIKELAMSVITDDPGKVFRERINKGVNYNNEPLFPLKKSTLNIRAMRGRPGNKPLVDTGKLLKSIKTVSTKKKIGVRFMKYGMHQAEGFVTNNHFAVKRGNKILGWRDYSKGIRVPSRPWIHPQEPFAGLIKSDKEILIEFEEEIEETDRSLIGLLALGIAFDVDIFATRVARHIAILKGTGVSDTAIAGILSADLQSHVRIFGEFRNSLVRGIVFGNNQFSRIGQIEVYGDSISLFRWVTVQGHKICDDCHGREGQIDTFDNWEVRGLPGSGWSICGGNCYCILVPENINSSDTLRIDQNQLA